MMYGADPSGVSQGPRDLVSGTSAQVQLGQRPADRRFPAFAAPLLERWPKQFCEHTDGLSLSTLDATVLGENAFPAEGIATDRQIQFDGVCDGDVRVVGRRSVYRGQQLTWIGRSDPLRVIDVMRFVRFDIEHQVCPMMIRLVPCAVQFLVVEPPKLAGAHADFFVTGPQDTLARAIHHQVVSITACVVFATIDVRQHSRAWWESGKLRSPEAAVQLGGKCL